MTENNLLKQIETEQNRTRTENGASACRSSGEALVDLFAVAGALRSRPEEADLKFRRAMAEDRLLGTRMAFYTRDIRGGLGEREIGRRMFRVLAEDYPEILRKNLPLIAEYGRWDDLVDLLETPLQEDATALIRTQLSADSMAAVAGGPVSLLAKWLPSINTSSYKSRRTGRMLAKALGMNERIYRKLLSSLRCYLNVTEVPMSAKHYDYLRYGAVPAKAMNNYHNAFCRNDPERFQAYLTSLEKGKAKINASVLYPYDITEKMLYHDVSDAEEKVLEAQWKALPDYVTEENRFLIMADVSASMSGRPLATSTGLALYFAEHNTGAFANVFMTFSSRPELVRIKGRTLKEKLASIASADWEMNTDLEAAFSLVLKTAVRHKSPKEDLPASIVIISDMEIDECTNASRWGFYDEMKARFADAGYVIPNIVFWNVSARHDTFHADAKTKGVQLASGQSASVFQSLVSGVCMTPYEYMCSVLNSPRYQPIQI